MDFNTIIYTKEEGAAIVQINRPEVLNAMNEEVLQELEMVADDVFKDENVKVLVIKGNETAFAAGADIKNFITYTPRDAHQYLHRVQVSMGKLLGVGKPTIASIAGYALGGGFEMALACDLRIAAHTAHFGLPEVNLGIIPGGGGTQRLTRLIGEGKAKELIMLGEVFDAQTAYDLGLVNFLVPLADLEEQTRKLAKKLCRKPPLAMRTAKELIHLSYDVDIYNGLMMEKEKFAFLFSTNDQKEGMAAFLEGRKATFTGR